MSASILPVQVTVVGSCCLSVSAGCAVPSQAPHLKVTLSHTLENKKVKGLIQKNAHVTLRALAGKTRGNARERVGRTRQAELACPAPSSRAARPSVHTSPVVPPTLQCLQNAGLVVLYVDRNLFFRLLSPLTDLESHLGKYLMNTFQKN